MPENIKSIADAIKEFTLLLREWIAGQPIRKLRGGVDIADRICKRYRLIVPQGIRDKTMEKWIDEFYDRIS